MPNLSAEAVAEWLTKQDPNNATTLLAPVASMPEGAEPLLIQLGKALDAAQARVQRDNQGEKIRQSG